MFKVARVEDIRRLDRLAVESYGLTEDLLMENAGAAVARLVTALLGAGHAIVFAGTGNNGGDGLVAARHLASSGVAVEVFIVGDRSRMKPQARREIERLEAAGIEAHQYGEEAGLPAITAVSGRGVIVDALLGIGLNREVRGAYREAIEEINELSEALGLTVVSVDIPSGVHGDTGRVMGVAVRADYTVTFGLPKPGCLLYPGAEYCGEVYVATISYPRPLTADPELKMEVNWPPDLPPRKPDTHKGDYGKALFVAGASRYLGAPMFASLSFLKAGGGYSVLAAPRSIVPFLGARASEVVYAPMPETPGGAISLDALDEILGLAGRADIVVVGPGLSREEGALRLTLELLRRLDKPVLVDGDGLYALSKDPGVLEGREAPTILTPHLGEMSRLTGLTVDEIRADRLGVLREWCSRLGSIIVLKGAHTLIGSPDGRVYFNLTGNPGMATPGSGDVLAGTIAAMYGLGLDPLDAARTGVYVHGLAGDLAAEELGVDGVTATAIMEKLGAAVAMLREERDELASRLPVRPMPP